MRKVKANNKPWVPCLSDRVCSDHFKGTFEGEYGWPTEKHPDPSRNLGYEPKTINPRRVIVKHPPPKKKLERLAYLILNYCHHHHHRLMRQPRDH